MRKFSLQNFGAWCPLTRQKGAIPKSFLRGSHSFYQFVKVFSLESFPLYDNHLVTMDLNSKHIIFEQVCLREHQIFGAKDSHRQFIFGLGEWIDSNLGCTLRPHAYKLTTYLMWCYTCIPHLIEKLAVCVIHACSLVPI